MRDGVGGLGTEYLATLKGETPRGRGEKSPQLVKNYQVAMSYGPQHARYSIENRTSYLPYVVNGRPAITAAPGKMLRFSINGQVFFRKRVRAAKANPFPARVQAKMRGRVGAAQRAIVAGIIRRARGG